MSLYAFGLFLHVSAALGLGAALGIEWTAMLGLRRAVTHDDVRRWAGALRPLTRIGGPAMLLLLLSGGYMAAANWGMRPWISMALLAMVAMAGLGGGVTGRRMRALGQALRPEREALDASTRGLIRDRALLVSLHARTALLAAIVMLMTVRPGWIGAAIIVVGAAALGYGSAQLAGARERERVGVQPA